ncbi:MAG: hypothetical protein M3R01_12310 [Actinomycetota bacterium]|nr:hypothetical protein [Actinomycetota bacterium]
MPKVTFRARPTRMAPDEVERRLAETMASSFPGAAITVSMDDRIDGGGAPRLSWYDGPSGSAVADAVGEVVNWEVRVATSSAGDARIVLLDRTFSDRALAVAVVRHQASHVRPYDSATRSAVESLSGLLDEDDPQRSGYPVTDAIAAMLLDTSPPPGFEPHLGPDVTRADHLSAKLSALGYDALWARAWGELR